MTLHSFSPIQYIDDPALAASGVELNILRLDRFFPPISGNKYFKLKHNVDYARRHGYQRLLSFGGAYSNHIHALALAGRHYGFGTIGLIRGEQSMEANLNPTLQDAVDAGMDLHFLDRSQYRNKHDKDFVARLQAEFSDAFIIPEGGSNLLGVKGCMEIVGHIQHHLDDNYDLVIVPCGTAATLAGIAAALPDNKQVVGVAVLKNAQFLNDEVTAYLQQLGVAKDNWQILLDYHGGGYAKLNQSLAHFIQQFEQANTLQIEPVYTGKMFYGLYDQLIHSAQFKGKRIVAVHTGGLQGLRGIGDQLEKLQAKAVG
ncbi:1-aminocyclopropane-1-carboxylate deaminase/D-cysteine desulfhydrase [Oceanicoccus sagamiensis]|uniref:Tryptophan synthase beta chain-like PALP domain-containing protein n=1 Tax=Oceanicoccus sagamiensis TaxID=716816 RepID=A0A1X9NKH8_9GAMM|nr:pyridoxal-phosphate dependent enzyme [Oceanicoccus sagamiensis]ARN75949.1 hypothetical protein BST96_18720 [Oceanicoccus sagamiensis]